jgi:hypothetical protein
LVAEHTLLAAALQSTLVKQLHPLVVQYRSCLDMDARVQVVHLVFALQILGKMVPLGRFRSPREPQRKAAADKSVFELGLPRTVQQGVSVSLLGAVRRQRVGVSL